MNNLRLFYVVHSTEPNVFVMSHTYDEALGMAKKYFTQKNTPKTKNKAEILKIKELPVVCSESFIKNPKLYKCTVREGFISEENLYVLSYSYEEAASFCKTEQKKQIFDADNSLIKQNDDLIKGIVNCDIINYELGMEVIYDRV